MTIETKDGMGLVEKENKLPCLICGADAQYSYSPDLDIRGLGACEYHRSDVATAYEILLYLGETDFKQFIATIK